MACGLATTCRVEGRLPRLELAFGLPFFHQNLFKRMNATILVLLFSSISPGGATCFKQEENCENREKRENRENEKNCLIYDLFVFFISYQWIDKKPWYWS